MLRESSAPTGNLEVFFPPGPPVTAWSVYKYSRLSGGLKSTPCPVFPLFHVRQLPLEGDFSRSCGAQGQAEQQGRSSELGFHRGLVKNSRECTKIRHVGHRGFPCAAAAVLCSLPSLGEAPREQEGSRNSRIFHGKP